MKVKETSHVAIGSEKTKIINIYENSINCEIENQFVIDSHKIINIPDGHKDLKYCTTEKDTEGFVIAREHHLDLIFASSIRNGYLSRKPVNYDEPVLESMVKYQEASKTDSSNLP
ncbi:hypothetical protein QTP88_026623 [Uroleucon formosanum]